MAGWHRARLGKPNFEALSRPFIGPELAPYRLRRACSSRAIVVTAIKTFDTSDLTRSKSAVFRNVFISMNSFLLTSTIILSTPPVGSRRMKAPSRRRLSRAPRTRRWAVRRSPSPDRGQVLQSSIRNREPLPNRIGSARQCINCKTCPRTQAQRLLPVSFGGTVSSSFGSRTALPRYGNSLQK